ncbi:MAG: spermidine synthase, partial [Gammaproteobacteria bacterium]
GYLFCLYLLLALPFFFAANAVGSAIYRFRERLSLVYAADLAGAGAGSLLIVFLLFHLFPGQALLVLSLLGLLATAAAVCAINRSAGIWWAALAIPTLAICIMPLQWASPELSPYKGLRQQLRVPGAEIVHQASSPLGYIAVVKSPQTPLRYAPGLSLNAMAGPPEQLAVFTDADGMTAIDRYDGDRASLRYLDQMTSALPYHLNKPARVLILGAGTGLDVLQAFYHEAESIDAVELNPQIIGLVRTRYAEFAGNLYAADKTNLHVGEARGFITSTRNRYDLIQIALLDAFGASAAGHYAPAENYLYTVEALQDYFRHLKPGGYLGITRWIKMPPRDTLRLLATAAEALKRLNIGHPERQILLVRGWQTSTLAVKNGVITPGEIEILRRFCDNRSFDPAYFPGILPKETNRYNILPQPYFFEAAKALLGDGGEKFLADYKFDIRPSTDDRPYFFHFFKWATLPEILSLFKQGGISLLESGYLVLIATLLQALIASFLLMLLPLMIWKAKLGFNPSSSLHYRTLLYFFTLGLAFLFVEIAFIQKFVLFLHHPLYAVTVVLSTFLLSAGLGSRFCGKIGSPRGIFIPVAAISLLSAGYVLFMGNAVHLLLETKSAVKIALSILLIAPLGFFMGMPFPMAMRRLSETVPALIPWAWGVNGFASVISAILATLIAVQFGFNILVLAAVMLYFLAALNFPPPLER